MKQVRSYTFAEAVAEAQRELAEEQAKFDAMTEDEKAEYIAAEQVKRAEAEDILKQLRGFGFSEIKI
jgi:hypothetical protein